MIGLKAAGPCVVEFASESSDGRVGGINVFGTVVIAERTGNRNICRGESPSPASAAGNILGRIRGIGCYCWTKEKRVSPFWGGRITKLARVWIFAALLSTALLGQGGGYADVDVLRPSQRQKIRRSAQRKAGKPVQTSTVAEGARNIMPRSFAQTYFPTFTPGLAGCYSGEPDHNCFCEAANCDREKCEGNGMIWTEQCEPCDCARFEGGIPSSSPTISGNPSVWGNPSESPTLSYSPSLSGSPSAVPSSSPTFPGGCMNFTVTILLPPATFNSLEFSWRLETTKDGEEIVWEVPPYELSSGDPRANSLLVEDTNGTNSNGVEVCLPAGIYTFGMGGLLMTNFPVDGVASQFASKRCSEKCWKNGFGVRNIWFVLSSNGERILCGDILQDIGSTEFQLPFESSSVDEGKLTESCLSAGQTSSPEHDFKLLQCYSSAFVYSSNNNVWNKAINRIAWFEEECGPMLIDDACQSDDARESGIQWVEDFCAYRLCAHYGGPNACECLYNRWDCNHGSGCDYSRWACNHESGYCDEDEAKNDARECCIKDGDIMDGDSCSCVIGPKCDDGNAESCVDFAEYCCNDDGCKNGHHRKACVEILQDEARKNIDDFGSFVAGLTICTDAEKVHCEDVVEVLPYSVCAPTCYSYYSIAASSCGCQFWLPLCSDYGGFTCEFAAGRCCGSPTNDWDSFICHCDFFNHAKSLGHDLEEDTCPKANTRPWSNPNEERTNLVLFFNSTGGIWWHNRAGWASDESPHCEWNGVSCTDGFVSGLDLSANNLTGSFPSGLISAFPFLKSLKLADNNLLGEIGYNSLYHLRFLKHIDVSMNYLRGEVDILISPSVEYLNFSYNNITCVSSILKFKRSYVTLQILDLSFNGIDQDAAEIMQDIPLNLKQLILTGNLFQGGTWLDRLPILENMLQFQVNDNILSGTLPDFSRMFPRLQVLNLSNQSRAKNGGLSGTIPRGWSNLLDLSVLDFSYNSLSGAIPPDVGNLPQLMVFNVSNNKLSGGFIPTEIGKLVGSLEIFDVSNNELQGLLPVELGHFKEVSREPPPSLILSGYNNTISAPAPLSLCQVDDFDLKNDSALCPPERNALKKFYESAKGREWSQSENWLDEYAWECTWYGVTCKDGIITGLNLTNNGLSGQVDTSISILLSLEILDLSDNDVRGIIPTVLGLLFKLTHLRLSYNAFGGTLPSELSRLQHLQLVHLHGNRLSGPVPELNTQNLRNESSFVADCGVPSAFDKPMECKGCTICCNTNGECESKEKTRLENIQLPGFENYKNFIWVFVSSLLGYIGTVVICSSLYDRYFCTQQSSEAENSAVKQDKKYAIETIGADSVYSFFLSKSRVAWIFALSVMTIQVITLGVFVWNAERDFTDDKSDYIYSWRCPRNNLDCKHDADISKVGWSIFSLLMISHMAKDIINGLKLLLLCGKQRHSIKSKIRFFVGGLFLTFVAGFTIYASTVYNIAIARSDTEIIANSVIILFVVEMDEQFHAALVAASSFWGGKLPGHQESGNDVENDIEALSAQLEDLKSQLKNRDGQLEKCVQDLAQMRQFNEQLELRLRILERRNIEQDPASVSLIRGTF